MQAGAEMGQASSRGKIVAMRCPICRKEVHKEGAEFPFCSQRCRTQDLANWANGVYRVPVKDEAPPEGGAKQDSEGD
jgi:endogenous inhibitor of DNA gyrase (YacG/DUF329 family)